MSDDLIHLGLIDEEDILLDEAALTLAALDHPDTDLQPYHDLFAAMAEPLAGHAGDATSPTARAEALAAVIAGRFGFVGDADTYDDPANADLIGVVDRRRGLPVSLSILYVAAARRIGWTAHVLDVPGHVLVLIGGEGAPVMIDPFRGGRVVDGEQLATLLQAVQPGRAAATHVAAMPNRAVLVRLLLNQATRAEASGHGRRALTLYGRMTVMAPGYGHAWWESARLQLIDGDVAAARRSLSAMLEITRDPALRARVSGVLESLPSE